jgi:hypothetical protein
MTTHRIERWVLVAAACGFAAVGAGCKASGDHAGAAGANSADTEHVERFTWEGEPPEKFLAEWEVTETNGAGTVAAWGIAEFDKAPSGSHVLSVAKSVNKGDTFNLLLSRKSYPANLSLDVLLKPVSGLSDQGGGVAWRAFDANNYYVARWNPLEENLRLYKVVQGQRTLLKGVDVIADPLAFHQLGVRNSDQKIQVYFDQKVKLEVEDGTFERGGRIGLWTKSDAATVFDDLNVAWD